MFTLECKVYWVMQTWKTIRIIITENHTANHFKEGGQITSATFLTFFSIFFVLSYSFLMIRNRCYKFILWKLGYHTPFLNPPPPPSPIKLLTPFLPFVSYFPELTLWPTIPTLLQIAPPTTYNLLLWILFQATWHQDSV